MLSGFLNNISVYWVADGKKLAQVALSHGGNDLVGTAFSEEVYRAAGKSTNSSLLDLVNLVKEIKRNPAQRDTFFNIIRNSFFVFIATRHHCKLKSKQDTYINWYFVR